MQTTSKCAEGVSLTEARTCTITVQDKSNVNGLSDETISSSSFNCTNVTSSNGTSPIVSTAPRTGASLSVTESGVCTGLVFTHPCMPTENEEESEEEESE